MSEPVMVARCPEHGLGVNHRQGFNLDWKCDVAARAQKTLDDHYKGAAPR